jgi:hypothetical protein
VRTDYKEILEEIFQEHDQGIPYYDDVQKENRKNTYKSAIDMTHIWRAPKVTISREALEKYGIEII